MDVTEAKISYLTAVDIADIEAAMNHNDVKFLYAVLSGEGWVPYNQLTPDELEREFEERSSELGLQFENHPMGERVKFWQSILQAPEISTILITPQG